MCPVFPKRIEIELSNTCNLRCTYCPRQYLDNPKGFMNVELFRRIVDEASNYPETILVLHRRGESLLHPDFINICNYVKDKFNNIQLATNATLLDTKNSNAIIGSVDFISFSIDIPKVFDKTRIPASYAEVEQKILHFLSLNKGRAKTQVSMVKTKDTPDANAEMFKKIWTGKVDRIRIYQEHSVNGVFGAICDPRQDRKPCVMPNYELLIYYDGKVGRCNHDWNGEPMGDVNFGSIAEIWHNKKYIDLREQHATLRISDPVCAGCDSWYAETGVQGTGEVITNG